MWIFLILILLIIIIKRNALMCMIAKIMYVNGNIDGAERLFARACKKETQAPQYQFLYGYILLRQGKVEKASKVLALASMSRAKPATKYSIKAMRALVLWKSGDIDTAIEMLEEIITEYKNTTIYQDLGLLYILKGNKHKALSFNQEAYEFNSDDNMIMDNLAEAYALCGYKEKSEEMYEKLLKKEPRFAEAYWGYGLLLFEKGEKDKGLEFMRKSLDKRITFLSVMQKEEIEAMIKEYEKK